jgi:hypothetical protein
MVHVEEASEYWRLWIAAEVRAEMARQHKDLTWACGILRKTKTPLWRQWRGIADFRPQELVDLAAALGVPVTQFLPPASVPEEVAS